MTQPFVTGHGLSILALVLIFLFSGEMADLLDQRGLMHHLLPLDLIVDGQIYLQEMLVLIHGIRVQLSILH